MRLFFAIKAQVELITLIMVWFHAGVPVSCHCASLRNTKTFEWRAAIINVISSFKSHICLLFIEVFKRLKPLILLQGRL